MTHQRYQLTKHAVAILGSGHPWIFKSHLSSAAENIPAGTPLKLVDAANETVGYGVREDQGVIGIRILKKGPTAPDASFWSRQLNKALKRRENLSLYTNGFRCLHGESDGTPGVVIDIYDKHGVLQTYSSSIDYLGRYLGRILVQKLRLESLVWRLPAKRKQTEKPLRVLFGNPPDKVSFREGELTLVAPIRSGQKGGTFLDLRNLRKWLTLRKDLHQKRVLNLFSYTGTLGLACEKVGAKEIWNVDIAPAALEFGKKYHTLGRAQIRNVEADIFKWIRTLGAEQRFDLIIIDPPQMASDTDQVKLALKTYQLLYETALKHVSPGGRIVAACCTSRIERRVFEQLVGSVLGTKMKLEANLRNEDDHPIGFKEADYLKILVYRKR